MIPVPTSVCVRSACAFALAVALGAPAFAASNDAAVGQTGANPAASTAGHTQQGAAAESPGQGAAGQTQPMGRQVAQKLRDDLGKAGFTDIHIMPSSFLVRAKDSSGNPVMMVINPDSITAVTEEQGGQGASGSAQTGRTSTGGSQPVTPGAPPAPTKTTP